MSTENEGKKITSRRQFIKGAALVGAGGVTAGVLAGCAAADTVATAVPAAAEAVASAVPAAAEAVASAVPAIVAETQKWDAEAEIVVLGYGGAGAATAITAADLGATVLVLEKQSEDKHTSNTQMSAGVFISPDTAEDAVAYMGIAARINVDMPESQDLDDETIQVWAKYMAENQEWMKKMGATDFVVYAKQGRDERWPGNAAIKAYQVMREDGGAGVGTAFFAVLDAAVKARNVEIRWETPAQSLITDADGQVIGVKAQGKDGELAIKATKGVVLTTGGFEFDEAAKRAYLPTFPMTFYGNPDNTGDGMRMAAALGADMWHMPVLGGGFKIKPADFPTALAPAFGKASYMIVDKNGKRFKDETKLGGYSGYWNALVYDTVKYTWPRIPAFWVFDETRRTEGPIVTTFMGAAGPIGMYEWSKDNSEEIAKGWIVKGDTIEDLAGKIGVDPAALAEQLAKFNADAAAGADSEFGRAAETLGQIATGPFYAIQLWPGLNNTFGGPRRNAKAQIVNAFGQPIPRLYSAGELGSIYVQYPQGGANVGECIAFGRIAAENAVAEEPLA